MVTAQSPTAFRRRFETTPVLLSQSPGDIWLKVSISGFFGVGLGAASAWLLTVTTTSSPSRGAVALGIVFGLIALAALAYAYRMWRRLGGTLRVDCDGVVLALRRLDWATLKSVNVTEKLYIDEKTRRQSASYEAVLRFRDAEIHVCPVISGYLDLIEHACAELRLLGLRLDGPSEAAWGAWLQREAAGEFLRGRVVP